MLPEATQALREALELHGNPSSLHTSGRAARNRVEESREHLARLVGADPHEVIFTSGGTEADNLAVKGTYWSRVERNPRRRRVLISAGEHHAVLDPVQWLADEQGAELVILPVDPVGRLDLDALRRELEQAPDTVALVSVMAANNEVGTIQPIREAAEIAAEFDIPIHTDAIQALGWTDLDFASTGVNAMSLSAHKIGGPIGCGALVLRRGLQLVPVEHGGGQERQIRSGTIDLPNIAAFAAATATTVQGRDATRQRIRELRDRLVAGVRQAVPSAVLQGDADPVGRLDPNAHFIFPGCEGDSLLYLLDAAGVEVSTGSACSAGVPRPSHVLLAMGLSDDDARGALRFSLGVTSTQADVDAAVNAIGPAVHRAQNAGLASRR